MPSKNVLAEIEPQSSTQITSMKNSMTPNDYTLREKKFDGTAKEVALLQVVAHHPRIQKSDFFRFQVARGRGQSN